jgi:hypothetical protein
MVGTSSPERALPSSRSLSRIRHLCPYPCTGFAVFRNVRVLATVATVKAAGELRQLRQREAPSNFPLPFVSPPGLNRNEPILGLEDLRQVQDCFLVPEGIGAKSMDIPYGEGTLPARQRSAFK